MSYNEKLRKAISKSGSCLCVGLDPNIERIPISLKEIYSQPEELVVAFLKQVIDVTKNSCAAFKPNLGFFEALGGNGLAVFQEIIDYIPEAHVIIADAKRGDISSTAEHYARAYFEIFDVDAVTVNPLMGFESLNPFLNYPGKAVYCLTLTSNPGASDLLMKTVGGKESIASFIAGRLSELQAGSQTHIGMVTGATRADDLTGVIRKHPKASLLIPGIGTQGGSVTELKQAIKDHPGIPLINSSRSILYAGENNDQWQQAVENRASEFKKALYPITKRYV